MRAIPVLALLVLTAPAPSDPPVPALSIDPAVRAMLARDLKFSPGDFGDLARGKIVRRTLDTKAPTEIAVVGAVRVYASMESFVEAFRDITRFKRDEGVIQIGRFSDPPTMEDMAGLSVDDDDFNGEDCRVGDCPVRLPARDLVQFRNSIDWHAPGAKAHAAAMFKSMVLEHVRAYWSGEGQKIEEYDDGKRPIRPAAEFEGILNNSPYIEGLAPGLPEHLRHFPSMHAAGFEDFLYWSKERFGIAPFITVTHVTIARPRSGGLVITSKDVYSSRYIDSSLGMSIASGPGDATGFVLVYLNRSRANALRGGLSGLRKSMVERRARSGIEESLKKVKARLEQRP
jgi:hypothetical protein